MGLGRGGWGGGGCSNSKGDPTTASFNLLLDVVLSREDPREGMDGYLWF